MPLVSSSLEPSQEAFSDYFDLGVTPGTNVTSGNFCYWLSGSPLSVIPNCAESPAARSTGS